MNDHLPSLKISIHIFLDLFLVELKLIWKKLFDFLDSLSKVPIFTALFKHVWFISIYSVTKLSDLKHALWLPIGELTIDEWSLVIQVIFWHLFTAVEVGDLV